ncbi:uncharacterized protein LOC112349069 [Selaginella moellendorffii]|uniref:uncharacterized protein LOC112349069 n=1 Tax=Selaginella moellendorffii TaxID=88036 RepID=UPI000D1CF13B|nr:uncharacterized protein LOC112349069 [Selaginella moellendorffii]|eukprot:XP_024538502.1 uncharacterized protein LOC112349069 [Selaginella moellendorffii]
MEGFHPGNKGIHSSGLRFVDEVLADDVSSSAGASNFPGDDASSLSSGTGAMDLPEVASDSDLPKPGIFSSDAVEAPQLEAPPQGGDDLIPDFSLAPGEESQGGGVLDVPDGGELGGNPLSSAAKEASDALKGAAEDVSSTLSSIQESGANFFGGIRDSITGSINKAENSIQDAYDSINGSILRVIKGAGEKVDDQPSSNPPGLSIDLTSPFRTGTPVNNALKEVVIFVKNGVGGVGHAVSDVYSLAKGSAPSEVQNALSSAEQNVFAPLSSVLHQAFDAAVSLEKAVGIDPENPIIPIFLVGGGSAYLGFLLWDSKYGGYAGDLSADTVFDMLKKEKVVLVDVRPQELKERDGVPDVRRGARFKLASITGLEVERPVRDLLRSADDVNSLLTATLICNLRNVTSTSKVVVMDADGTQSKKIAKALRKVGIRRSYRLEGGFAAWLKTGLGQKPGGQETPLRILKEETEAVVEELKPAGIAAIAVGSVASIYALSEWEKTLQLLGVIAIVQLIYQRLESYESADDFAADLRVLQAPLRVVLQWLGGQPRTSKLELATSPSTTAVQDRVVQAAAKHGSKPDESQAQEQEQDATFTQEGPSIAQDA